MTEEKQGGTTPEPEAIASATDQASEDTVAAVAVADEPATSTDDVALTEPEAAPAAEAAADEPASEPFAASADADTVTEGAASDDSDTTAVAADATTWPVALAQRLAQSGQQQLDCDP